jgi:putative transposase
MTQAKAAESIGTTEESVRRWVVAAKANGTMPKPPCTPAGVGNTENDTPRSAQSPYRPKNPGQGLADYEEAAIVELRKKHPSYGPAQVRAQLKRFRGWRLSIKAIKRVFKANGFETVHRGSRPEGPEPVRFEAPHRCALWQMDFADMRISGSKLHLLVALDDFSRFCVGHVLCDSPSSEMAVQVLRQAIARHGKPEAIRTDRAGAFVANTNDTDFARVLDQPLAHPGLFFAPGPNERGEGAVSDDIVPTPRPDTPYLLSTLSICVGRAPRLIVGRHRAIPLAMADQFD